MANTTIERASQSAELITRQSKTNFYYSFLFLPKLKRQAIETVYAFCRLVDDIVDEDIKVDNAQTELELWRIEIKQCFTGNPTTSLGKSLKEVITHFPIKQEYFQDLITGMEMDLNKCRYSSFEELEKYCYHVAGVIGLMCIEIFGYKEASTKEYAINLGKALQLVNIARDLKEDATRDRVYLPQDEMLKFGYSEQELLGSTYNDKFIALMLNHCQRAQSFFQKAQNSLSPNDRGGMFAAEIMGAIYYRILEKITAESYNVFDKRIRLSSLEKAFVALQAWAKCRYF
ncbi:MAG: phytoene synthase [bacterium]|nr:MAG: phytoene synthase [bacterium]